MRATDQRPLTQDVDAWWRAANYLSVGPRANHPDIHVRGYKEEGTTTTPFDRVMLNDLDRYHLVMDVIERVPGLSGGAARVYQAMLDRRTEARTWTRVYGEDIPEVAEWLWPD